MNRPSGIQRPFSFALGIGTAVLLVDLVKGEPVRDAIVSAIVTVALGFAFLWIARAIEDRYKPLNKERNGRK